ncbi:xanthine dehydrogenase family protein molybdopterin-binding subunit [Zunongwangia sp. F363]|uniref:Xanthine dehydrogenase family protein molybdopterin-binding subunit n=1 Tax=Autumnicola tepida TaxID=3075595 RepID=A0ABU3C8J2_9FLAO|nr:xanthine dehydrogenase family protein molybdopterin-binding subunit [Zunongwangia sp. F363]MDT0642664.1 xanthine dehydrogenase family protein molybdopterin-binding subunit [Zunongwangia sp. F363]
MIADTKYIGKSTRRVDGIKKVTGQAPYIAEFNPADLVHGYIINSTIAKGKITAIHKEKALQVPGVREIFTHENVPVEVKIDSDYTDPLAPPGNPFRPLYDENILYNGQPVAMVVADTFETAAFAAGLVQVEYEEEEAYEVDIRRNLDNATHEDVPEPPEPRGNAADAFNSSEVKIDTEYYQPREYHNPMEPFASVASWNEEEGSFSIYDKIQGVSSSQGYIAGIFNLEKEKVRVISPFIGGAFGSGLRPQYQLFFAAMASKALKLPVKVVMTRTQMFSFGHRPACLQRMKLSADKSGKLTSIRHQAFAETSRFEKFNETVVDWSGLMYQCENVALDYQLVPVDVYTPLDMRAPGGSTGMYALECAMDELAIEAGVDPLELRIINYAEKDQNEDKPFSSKELKACYQRAAEKFGWQKRKSEPRSIKQGNQLVGYGMASGVWEAMQQKSSAKAILTSEGKLTVSSGTADIGTGTYTIMSQIAAEILGLSIENVEFKLGDSTLPDAPIEGGSWTASSVGSAVKMVCSALQESIFELATQTHPDVFENKLIEDATFSNAGLSAGSGATISYAEIISSAEKKSIQVEVNSEPEDSRSNYSCYTHSCVMVEVHVDEDTGMISIPRVVNAIAGGKILNPKTAESQIIGGVTWGIGMALEEEGMMDSRNGRIMNANLAEYHVAVQADVKEIDVIFVEEQDDIVNPLGAKGLGEIGIVGVASAISNAIYNATGKRVRELPITLDKVL